MFTSPIWELKLSRFADLFTKRREQFEFLMGVHTAVGVDKANVKLDAVIEQSEELTEKCASSLYIPSLMVLTTCIRMKMMMRLFQGLVSPLEKKLTARVREMGGTAVVLEDEQAMESLAGEEFLLVGQDMELRRDRNDPFNFVELRQEIKANVDEAIEKSAESFNRRFKIQKEQIVAEIQRALRQEGSRTISGPHDRVVDPVWREVPDLFLALTSTAVSRIYKKSGRTW